MAEEAGLDRSYVAGVETGQRNTSIDAIIDLAHGLQVLPAVLFEWLS